MPGPIAEYPAREISLNGQVGALVTTEELWWQVRYHEIAKRGYQHRLLCHPDWQPLWLRSRKDFFTVEDCHLVIVRVAATIFFLFSLHWRWLWTAMDAIHVRDDLLVTLRKVLGPHELRSAPLLHRASVPRAAEFNGLPCPACFQPTQDPIVWRIRRFLYPDM